MRKMFINNLPTHKGSNVIDWEKSIGMTTKFIYDNVKGEMKIIDFDKGYLYINYNNINFKISTSSFTYCYIFKYIDITPNFKFEIGQILNINKKNITIINRRYKKTNNDIIKYYVCKCNICGYTQEIKESKLLSNHFKCAVCKNKMVMIGYNDIPTTDPWMIKYFQGGYDEAKLYTKCSNKKIYPICPDCGQIKKNKITIASIHNHKGFKCNCNIGCGSYPERIMYNILEQLNINFLCQYSPQWIHPRRYDFYFKKNNKKYIIEIDGAFHFYDNKMINYSVNDVKKIDNIKENLAIKHNITVIRINCIKSNLNYIKNNIIKSELKNIFDLHKINWIECEKLALSNKTKIICKIKKDNPNISIENIAKKMHMCIASIKYHLKYGSKLGWCKYESFNDIRKNKIKLVYNSWNNNESINDIAKKFNICTSTVKNYLKEANKLGFCNQDLNKSMKLRDSRRIENTKLFKLICDYWNDNQSEKNIAEKFNISIRKVNKYLYRANKLNLIHNYNKKSNNEKFQIIYNSWNLHEFKTIKEMSNFYNIDIRTIKRYLEKANKLGLCDYHK